MRLFSKKQTQKPSTASKSPQKKPRDIGSSKSFDQESLQEQEESSDEEEVYVRRNSTRSSRSNSKSPIKKSSSPVSSTSPQKKSPTKPSNPDGSLRGRIGRASTSSNLQFSPASPKRSFTQPRLDAQSASKLDRGSLKKASLSDTSDIHPLNLPPEEREKQRAALLAAERGYLADRMSASPNDEQQSNGDVVMGGTSTPATPARQSDEPESTPVPPPHKSTPDTPPEDVYDEEAAEAYKATGNKFFKAGDYKKAIAEYTRAMEAAPRNPTYISNRSAAYMGAHDYLEALEDARRADELDPDNTKILLRLARIYTALGRYSEALAIYNHMQPPASSKDMAPAVAMENYVSQAEFALREGIAGSMAIHALDQAERGLGLAVQPPRKWKLLRGEAYLKMGNVNALGDAQNVAMSLLRNNSQDPEALVLRGRALYAQGENEKALQHFRQAISCDPDYREAVKYLRLVQKLDKMKEDGNIAFKAGRFAEAVQLYTEALDIDPTNKSINSKILQNRALASIKLKEYQSAIDDCTQALNLDPTYLKARKTKARAMGESGNWDEAVKEYKSIAEQNPSEPGIAKDVRHAELELKKSKRKDYYKILGIEKDAGESEIKKAYRKLAIVHHPDKNPGDPLAEQKFKEIAEAYETLIDPQKKARYDSGEDLIDPSEMFGGGMGGFPGGVQIDPSMIFNMMGGMGGMGGGRGGPSFTFSSSGGSPFGDGGHPFGGSGGGGRSGFQGFSF